MLALTSNQREMLALMEIDIWADRGAEPEDIAVAQCAASEELAITERPFQVVLQGGQGRSTSVLILCESASDALLTETAPERRLLDNILVAAGLGSLGEPTAAVTLAVPDDRSNAATPLLLSSILEDASQSAVIVFGDKLGAAIPNANVSGPGLERILVDPSCKSPIWQQIVAWRRDGIR